MVPASLSTNMPQRSVHTHGGRENAARRTVARLHAPLALVAAPRVGVLAVRVRVSETPLRCVYSLSPPQSESVARQASSYSVGVPAMDGDNKRGAEGDAGAAPERKRRRWDTADAAAAVSAAADNGAPAVRNTMRSLRRSIISHVIRHFERD